MKKRIWRFHSWTGLLAGLGLLVIGFTGSLLVFHNELDALLGQQEPAVMPGSTRASLDAVVTAARARHPDLEVTSWDGNDDPRRADYLDGTLTSTGKSIILDFDPHTGALLEGAKHEHAVTDWLLDLHSALLLGTVGEIFVGVLGVLLMLSGLTGVYLYRDFWRHFFTLRWRASARIFFSDLHKMVGISSVAFSLLLGFTGAYWNLPIVVDLFNGNGGNMAAAQKTAQSARSLDAMIAAARKAIPGFHPQGIRYPGSSEHYYNVRGDVPPVGPFATGWGDSVHIDAVTGAVVQVTDMRVSLRARLEDMMEPLHYGTFGGLPIKLLWCLGGLAPGTLAVSGFLIWRRRQGRKSPVDAAKAPRPEVLESTHASTV